MSDESLNVALPAQFNLNSLPELYTSVDGAIRSGQSLAFDGASVERIDTAAVQFLVMCQRAQPTLIESMLPTASDTLLAGLADLGVDVHSATGNGAAA